jgi:Zn-dependent protease with chaperone function
MVGGRYFDASTAAAHEAVLAAAEDGQWRLTLASGEHLFDPAGVTVSERIGSIPRRVRWSNGAEFETPDNDGIDALLGGAPRGRFANTLERRWGIALAALVAVALVVFAVVRFGVPAAAGWAAARLPASVDRRIGAQSLQLLDRTVLHPSRLPAQRQTWLANLFLRMTAGLDDGHDYRLELRTGPIGPNAFALPSGIIVMTDELADLAANDEELMAVLAHEIGHVRGRHALRHIIQSAGVSAMALVVLGDVSSISALATAAPALLHARHSRELEREADGFARQWLADNHIPAQRFDEILCRIAARHGGTDEAPAFLSTHPAPGERARCSSGPGDK